MASITGFGGIFLRTDDPKALYAWYEQHLGLVKAEGASRFLPRRNTHRSSSRFSNKTMPTSLRHRKP